MVRSFIILVLAIISLSCMSSISTSECNMKKADKCMLELAMIGDRNWRFPLQTADMNKRCRRVKILERCIKEYSENCLKRQTRNTVSILVYSITRTNKQSCNISKKRNDFLKMGICGNRLLGELYDYMTDMTKAFYAIALYHDDKLKIPLACCNFNKLKRRIKEKVEETCPEHLPDVDFLLNGYTQDLSNIFCTDYTDDSDKCQTIIEKTPKDTKKQLEYESFIIPLAKIFDSIH